LYIKIILMNQSPKHKESQPKVANANTPFFSPMVQKKMSIGSANDAYEVEADTIANKVMRMSEPQKQNVSHTGALVQRKCAGCEQEEKIQMKPLAESIQRVSSSSSEASTAPSHVESQINSLRCGGSVMNHSTKNFMESRFGTDFSDVKIHTGSQAVQMSRELNAQAFTVGNDIYFNEGKYSPNSDSGKHLLAHELTHTVQQNRDTKILQRRINLPRDRPLDLNSFLANRQFMLEIAAPTEGTLTGVSLSEDQRLTRARDILNDMNESSETFNFRNNNELISIVRERLLITLYMGGSQDVYNGMSAFGYPNRGTVSLGPRVNLAARSYWTTDHANDDPYYFELTAEGRANPYRALYTLFTPQRNAANRTLIHCDYLLSLVLMRATADRIGHSEFNNRVREGMIPFVLRYNGFQDITTNEQFVNNTSWGIGTDYFNSVILNSESDMIIGDHVVFYNHPAYEDLNHSFGDPWKLENAILIERVSNEDRFQGHGFHETMTKNVLIERMMRWYNRKIDIALPLIRSNSISELQRILPIRNSNGNWEVIYHVHGSNSICSNDSALHTIPVRHLTAADYPNPFSNPCSLQLKVRRPSIRVARAT
jgi:hypothetical protein